jgi:medium-chain acyl-[acyl-carrier-protein] hydrolase
MKYGYNFKVDIHDVDYNGIARCSSLMRYIQTAAQSQLTENSMSYDNLKEMKRAFILSRIKMEFTKPVRAYAPLRAVSYPCDSRGYSFLRCYSLECDGAVIGRAVSVWALINTDTRALVRVNDFELGITTEEPDTLSLSRFTLPTALKKVGEYTVSYGDLDQNRHMNNTRYPDMYSNFLPMDGKRIHTISINYLNEAPVGERLSVYMSDAGSNLYYIRTVRHDTKVNSEAEIVLVDIE